MKNSFIILALVLILVACKEEKITGAVNDVDLNLLILDKSGENLLETGKSDAIKIYYIVNEEKQEVFFPNQDYPRNFNIYKFQNPGKYFIKVFPDTSDERKITTTLVQWSESDTDTIKTEIDRKENNSLIINKIWINNELKWDTEIGKQQYESGEMTMVNRFIKIIK